MQREFNIFSNSKIGTLQDEDKYIKWDGTSSQFKDIIEGFKETENPARHITLTADVGEIKDMTIEYDDLIGIVSYDKKGVPAIYFENVVIKGVFLLYNLLVFCDNVTIDSGGSIQSRYCRTVIRQNFTLQNGGSLFVSGGELSLTSEIKTFTVDQLSIIYVLRCILFITVDVNVLEQDYIIKLKNVDRLNERTTSRKVLTIMFTDIEDSRTSKSKEIEFANIPSKYYATNKSTSTLPIRKPNYGFGIIVFVILLLIFLALAYVSNNAI